MTSNAYYAFQQKLSYFDDDIELIDVLRTAVVNGDLTDPDSNRVLRHVDQERHRHISRRRNADGSRRNIINHLRSTIYSSYIKDLYEEVTEYLRLILEQASRNGFNSGQIVGEHNFKISASSILELGGWEAVCRAVTESIFQSLEAERSTLDLLRKMGRKLGLNIDEQLINDALPYLEVRHLLVHADGKLSRKFKEDYPDFPSKNNGYVNLTYAVVTQARDRVMALIAAYDREIIDKNLIAAADVRQP